MSNYWKQAVEQILEEIVDRLEDESTDEWADIALIDLKQKVTLLKETL